MHKSPSIQTLYILIFYYTNILKVMIKQVLYFRKLYPKVELVISA